MLRVEVILGVIASAVRIFRLLGLMIKEIQQLAAVYFDRPGEPIGARLIVAKRLGRERRLGAIGAG